jgi:3',5'-cyclic AMP phosphodiesterase CpdA
MRRITDAGYMQAAALLIAVTFAVSLTGCSDDTSSPPPSATSTVSFAVMSDPHLYDRALGVTGDAWEEYLARDPKLLAESDDIVSSMLESIGGTDADFLLIPGDLTKDGERSSHERMAALLRQTETRGIEVYVVPGNHDVNNPTSYSYEGGTRSRVPNVSPAEFATLYADFGYSQALYRHSSTLSYVAELGSGLWLLAIDGCRYDDPGEEPEVGGSISSSCAEWITQRLAEAATKNIRVIVMMHHAVVEHFSGQSAFPISADYVIDDWQQLAGTLLNAGVHLAFTGHTHANDITAYTQQGQVLYDISTGSPVTPPCEWRYVTLGSDGALAIETRLAAGPVLYGVPLQTYARTFFMDRMTALCIHYLQYGYGMEEELAGVAGAQIAGAFGEFYAGDEEMNPTTLQFIDELMQSGDATAVLVGQLLTAMRTDLPPADNTLSIVLP